MANIISDKYKKVDPAGRDYPLLKGDVKLTLKNVHNGKTEVVEQHNMITNVLADIFGNNYGGAINYDNFADLYSTYLGGVLLFGDTLDTSSSGAASDYGIPAYTSNPIWAHAGRTPMGEAPYDQSDDKSRGNPNSEGTLLTKTSTKLMWEWGTSAGNTGSDGSIKSIGLTHTDVGSYGCCGDKGEQTETQKLLNPFTEISYLTSRNYAYSDSATAVLALDGNTAYTFYLVNGTTVKVYRTPINVLKYKLQGGSLLPITAWGDTPITVTLTNDYNIGGKGGCYYHFEFSGNDKTLTLFGVPNEGETTLYKDVINLANWSSQTATHTSITATDASLWKFKAKIAGSNPNNRQALSVPTKAMIYNNNLFLYGTQAESTYPIGHPNLMYKINLSDTTDISEIDTTDYRRFDAWGQNDSAARTAERFAMMGGIIVHDSFLINGDKTFQTAQNMTTNVLTTYNVAHIYTNTNGISSPTFGINGTLNNISICKLYLATKVNLTNAVQKTSSQSMTVEYQLSEV